MKYEQISFLEPIKEPIEKTIRESEIYDATICFRCCCDKCIYSVELNRPLTEIELETIRAEESCFNCDDCYYYGMDNEKLSKDIVKFHCSRYKKANYYIEKERQRMDLEAERRRKNFKII